MEAITLKGELTNRFTDEEFYLLCAGNPDLRIERNNKLEIIIMSPVTTLSGFWNMEIARQLANWAIKDKTGFAFDSSAGYTLPDRSILSPDASWVSKNKWLSLSEDDKDKFAPICPDFVIEIKSKSDSIDDLKNKMKTWIANGAQLGWLIDVKGTTTYVYRTDEVVEKITGTLIEGTGVVNGFTLNLSTLNS